MLTALGENDCLISLPVLSSLEISLIKKEQKFFCPQCKAPLILKNGVVKIPHFAHKSGYGCEGFQEAETSRHIKGKISLFKHFSTIVNDVKLEHYLSSIRQRPDLFISEQGREFAVEFQCSEISVLEFRTRTGGYRKAGIEPLWILGKEVPAKGNGIISLSYFQQSFIRFSPHAGYWLAFYDSGKTRMNFYYHLQPLSSKRFTSETISFPLSAVPFPFRLPSKDEEYKNNNQFFIAKDHWIRNKMKYNRGVNDRFLKALYLGRDHILELPDFVGLPAEHAIHFINHPVEWQYFIWNDLFKKKKEFCLKDIHCCLDERVESGDLVCRNLPLLDEELQMKAIQEYLLDLVKRDIIKLNDNGKYVFLYS